MSVFQIKKDGAFQEPEAVKRKEDAWVEAESAKRKIDGAWQEVWSASKMMRMLSRTLTTGTFGCGVQQSSHNAGKQGVSYMSNKNQSGEVIFVIDGEFTNPVMTLMHSNWFWHATNQMQVVGAYLYAYGIKSNGTVEQVQISSSLTDPAKQFSHTFNGGTYKSVGFRVQPSNFGVTSFEPTYYFDVYDVVIAGKKCTFDPANSYDNWQW